MSRENLNFWEQKAEKKIIRNQKDLEELVEGLHQKSASITTVNGAFDILHRGHLDLLYRAAECGEVLFVLINSDASIKRYKHPFRPIIPLFERLGMMAAFSCVDWVIPFEEDSPHTLLSCIRPSIHVKAKESKYHAFDREREIIEGNGGKILFMPKTHDTSSIIKAVMRSVTEQSGSETCE